MKTHPSGLLLAAILLSTLFVACQKENTAPSDDPGIVGDDNSDLRSDFFERHLCRYQNYYYYSNYFGNACKSEQSTTLKADGSGKVLFTISNYSDQFSLEAVPVTEDSAAIYTQEVCNYRAGKTQTFCGSLRIKNGILSISLKSPGSSWGTSYVFYRAERRPGPLAAADYLGEYDADPLFNSFSVYPLRIVPGPSASEVILENVRGYGLNVAGRISGDTLYTERTPMDTLGNFLTATTSVLQGNVLDLSFIMQGPDYNPSSPTCSAEVNAYKKK